MLRTFWNMGQGHALIDFAPFVAGVAAWMGSRDGRRGTGRPGDRHRPAALGGPARHLGRDRDLGGGGLPGLRGRHVRGLRAPGRRGARRRGGGWRSAPRAWPRSAPPGSPSGAFFPSRFAAPLAAFGGFLAMVMSSQTGFSAHQRVGADPADQLQRQLRSRSSGIFYPYLPDLPIARMMFLAGIAVAAAGPARPARPGRRAVAAARRRGRHAGRGGGGRDRGRAGRHRPAAAARHGHPRAARRGQRPADPPTPRSAAAPPGSRCA